jgi:hypothetical protein
MFQVMASNVAISFDLMTIYLSQLEALPRLTPLLQLVLNDAEAAQQAEDDNDDNDDDDNDKIPPKAKKARRKQ